MSDFLRKFFKTSAVENPPKSNKRKRDALIEVINESPAPGARLLDCVLIPLKSPTAASSPSSPAMSQVRASVKKSVKEPGKRHAMKQAQKLFIAPTQPVIDDTRSSSRRSGRAARHSYVFGDGSDEEIEEVATDMEEEATSDFEEDDDDKMSVSDHPLTDTESVRSSSAPPNQNSEDGERDDKERATKKRKLDVAQIFAKIMQKPTQESKPDKKGLISKKTTSSKPPKSKKYKKFIGRELDFNQTPLTDIREIFLDITKKAFKEISDQDLVEGLKTDLRDVIDHLKGTPLRIGTMCSGTESPLLAMRLVQQCLKNKLGIEPFVVEHAFSAEIEPFKQAYIERNFHPEFLFRDITEMHLNNEMQMKGVTAYGALENVPRDIQVLVAGCSCVDFSTLNQAQITGFGERDGESEDTFMAVLRYTEWARPPIVILENVESQSAWVEFRKHFAKIEYATEDVFVDTKNFYIPHTRERRYMLCLDSRIYNDARTHELTQWKKLMEDNFQRRASSAVPEFLLPADDPRHIALRSREQGFGSERGAALTNWEACRGKHLAARAKEALGPKNPVTSDLPEHSDAPWMRQMVKRELDVIEICHLRRAKNNIDSQYKTRVIDISQNEDRIDMAPLGISGCLTPSGKPYLTDRSGPVTGLHALQLQGIPINELIFTSETDSELRDLAGNAMTSTIVGPAILGALIVASKRLPIGKQNKDETQMPVVEEISGLDKLETFVPDSVTNFQLSDKLLQDARNSSRLCSCEAQTMVSNHDIKVCISCQHTACQGCAGNPHHTYANTILRTSRLTPHAFVSEWRSHFPLRIQLQAPLDMLMKQMNSMDKAISEEYVRTIETGCNEKLVFQGLDRLKSWRVCYESPFAKLELDLAEEPQWSLFIKPSPQWKANSALRRIFIHPIARSAGNLRAATNFFDLSWWIPSTRKAKLSISGQGTSLSWKARLGLPDFANETVNNILDIRMHDSSTFHSDLSGSYELLPTCGTACDSLHKRVINNKSSHVPDMYFFLDPDPIGKPENDSFVFAGNHERIETLRGREIFAYLNPSWRPWYPTKRGEMEVTECGFWTKATQAHLIVECTPVDYRRLSVETSGFFENHSCFKPQAVLTAHFTAPAHVGSSWSAKKLVTMYDKEFYDTLAWPLKNSRVLDNLSNWITVDDLSKSTCQVCSPTPPAIHWRKDMGRKSKKDSTTVVKLIVKEDRLVAAAFEHLLKHRPSPYLITAKVDPSNIAHIQVGLNIRSLAHRALAKLRVATSARPQVQWRVDDSYVPRTIAKFRRFAIKSNKLDKKHAQPPGMKISLRSEQLRSLTWMKTQEQETGVSFICQEIEEAILPKLGWKAEIRATAKTRVKGGVLADQPSYGKTVTSLALIHQGFEDNTSQDDDVHSSQGFLKLGATLIITPPHLTLQWREEISKFLPDEYDKEGIVLVIDSPKDLQACSISQFMNAKIVILSSDVLCHDKYVGQLALCTSLPQPNTTGREFKAWLEHAMQAVPTAVAALEGALDIAAFKKDREQQFVKNCKDESYMSAIPSKRFKGKSYIVSKAKKSKAVADKIQVETDFERPEGELKSVAGELKSAWQGLAGPPLHLFHWNRVLVDEFTLLMDDLRANQRTPAYASITKLQADKRWVLSGTPALRNFVDVKSIAGLIGVDLGIDAFVPDVLAKNNLKTLRGELSSSELFRSFQESYSLDWHVHRHDQARKFIDTFFRQNDAEIGHIKTLTQLNPIQLVPAHRAVYEELSQYLHAGDMSVREPARSKGEGIISDREQAISESLKQANNAEEALLRGAAEYVSTGSTGSFGERVSFRQAQLESLKADIHALLRLAHHVKQDWENADSKSHYKSWDKEAVEDAEARAIIDNLKKETKKSTVQQDEAIETTKRLLFPLKKKAKPVKKAGKPVTDEVAGAEEAVEAEEVEESDEEEAVVSDEDEDIDAPKAGTIKASKEKPGRDFTIKSDTVALDRVRRTVLRLRPCARELTSRIRSLRFLQAIHSVQNSSGSTVCEKCGTTTSLSELRLLSSCGHIACAQCLEVSIEKETCVVDGCEAKINSHVIKSVECYLEGANPNIGRSFGAKLDSIAQLLDNEVSTKHEQAILFVLGDDLVKHAAECCQAFSIKHTAILQGDLAASLKIELFKKETSSKKKHSVLILNLNGSHATGLNLTNANHVIFLSPLHAPDQYGYESKMLQAIRRAHRFGQGKLVHIYRFVALKTIDVNILENRERSLAEPIWENPDDSSITTSAEQTATIPEMSRVVRLENRFALAPMSWVRGHKAEVLAGNFAADEQLSSAYEELDEDEAVDE